jgi:glycosyltransferase involved in cell wall biosynthesis
MRIVHVSLRYPPSAGGAENYARDLVEGTQALFPDKYDIRVLTSSLKIHHPPTLLSPGSLLDDPPYVQRLHYYQTPFLAYPRLHALPYYLKHHQPGIVEAYGFWYQPADAAARFARRHHLPFIFHPIYYENKIRHKPLWRLYKKTIGRNTFAAADVVVVISPYEQALIQAANFPIKRFELIPPGIDLPKFSTKQANPYLPHGLSSPILLSVSRISKGKGLESIINLMPALLKTFPQAHYVIIGQDFGYKTALLKKARALGVDRHIRFFGQVSTAQLIGAYQHASVLVHPSHYEAFGMVLAESLAAATPVVARNVTAIPFVAPHNKTALLFSTQDELLTSIRTLLLQTNLAQRLGRQGQTYVRENFARENSIKKLANLYDGISVKTGQ